MTLEPVAIEFSGVEFLIAFAVFVLFLLLAMPYLPGRIGGRRWQ